MRPITLPLAIAAFVASGTEAALADGMRLDLTDPQPEWFSVPPRRDHSGWAPEDPRAYPGVLVEYGRLGLIGENGQIDGRIRFANDATLRISAKPSRLLLRLKQRF
ncbi:hypothetical protein [Arenibaculum pallidiluteum]|uniref:hypothetical protein n=1 Tax=Arenibaculum pallidiluteum TaxID=2812559 RepID=UPI001A97C47F|nr:hypothetical protein [Arenibaculum pallidiluteum]